MAWRNAPALYNTFAPIFVPYTPKTGAEINAAKLAIPKTNPYYLTIRLFFGILKYKIA